MVKQKVISGIKWTFFSSSLNIGLNIARLSVLAHYLSPADFGLMAVALVVITFLQVFMEFGINSAIIYFKNLSKGELSSVYWLNIGLGVFVFIILLLITPFIEQFFSYPKLSEVLVLTATIIPISSVSQVYFALFEKQLEFRKLSIIEITSSFFSLIVAIYLAINEHGIYALVYSVITKTIFSSLLLLFYGRKIFLPYFYFSIKSLRRLLKYGIFNLGDKILNFFHTQLDIILIGKLLPAQELGKFSVSKQIANKPAYTINPILTRVMFPALSQLETDKNRLKKAYLTLLNTISSVNAPIYIFLIFFSKEIITVLLGENWLNATIIFQILCGYYLFRAIGNPVGVLLLSTGKADISFYWNILMIFLILISILIGSFYGIIGISISLATVYFLLIFIDWYFLIKRYAEISLYDYLINVFKPMFISMAAIIPVSLFNINMPVVLKLSIYGTIFILLYTFLSYILNRKFITTIFEFIRIK